jgi:hypothetical protein
VKKAIALLLLLVISLSTICASDISLKYEYEPYKDDEFKSWAMELRRAETIFFGSFALTLPLAAGIYSIATSLGAPTPEKESAAYMYQIAGAAGASLIIVGIDWILGRMGK